MENLVEIKDLTKQYQKRICALQNLSLTIPRGKIIGLLGPNGSGKSTLIKLVNGLLTPTQGEILINGQKPGIESKKVISYLPERTYFHNSMKISELLDFFFDFYTDFNRERATQMLASLQIDTGAMLKTLSKGTKEKVQLILVMSRDAQLYILDEPIAGVDPAARDYILNTIVTNYDPEATVVISTHLIADVEPVLDAYVFLYQGKVLRTGSVDEVRENDGKSLDILFREVFRCLPNC